MNLYEVKYTYKYSHLPAFSKKGYEVKYFLQLEGWEISQFKPSEVMKEKYISRRKLTPKQVEHLVFKSKGSHINMRDSSLFELWQFNSLVKHLKSEGFDHSKRVEGKESYYLSPLSDTFTTPCGNFCFDIIRNRTWYDIYFGISEDHVDYKIVKKYGGKVKSRIGHWMFGGTLESINEMQSVQEVFNLILKSYKKVEF